MYEEIEKKPTEWKRVKYEQNYGVLEQVQRLNEATLDYLVPFLLVENSRIYTFFDLFTFGAENRKEWGLDGIHKQPEFYDAVMYYLTLLLCN